MFSSNNPHYFHPGIWSIGTPRGSLPFPWFIQLADCIIPNIHHHPPLSTSHPAVLPPSTSNKCPVTKEESSEARNRTALDNLLALPDIFGKVDAHNADHAQECKQGDPKTNQRRFGKEQRIAGSEDADAIISHTHQGGCRKDQ
jgi:hypothetical protein